MEVFIITPKEIKANSRLEITCDDRALREVVQISQSMNLSPILGVRLYNEVLTSISENYYHGTTMSVTILNLIPFCKDYLKYQVVADFIMVNHYKLTNKGTFRMGDKEGEAATNDDITFYKTYYDNAANSYKRTLVEYLKSQSLILSTEVVDKDINFSGVYLDVDRNSSDVFYQQQYIQGTFPIYYNPKINNYNE
jgi:hypothetical protein